MQILMTCFYVEQTVDRPEKKMKGRQCETCLMSVFKLYRPGKQSSDSQIQTNFLSNENGGLGIIYLYLAMHCTNKYPVIWALSIFFFN